MANKITFKRNNFGKPTPAKIEFRLKIYVVVTSLVVTYLQTATYIPALPKEISTGILSLTVAIATSLVPFFGVHVEESTVPTEDVASIETEPTETPIEEKKV